jgi:hypothetical protein
MLSAQNGLGTRNADLVAIQSPATFAPLPDKATCVSLTLADLSGPTKYPVS